MFSHDPLVIAETLLGCLCTELGDMCPCLACVTPPLTPQDWCCDACSASDPARGQLAIWVDRTWPYTEWPQAMRADTPCPEILGVAAEIAVLLVRCAPQGRNGMSPTCDALAGSAEVLAEDVAAFWRAVRCCPFAERWQVAQVNAVRSPAAAPSQCVGLGARLWVDLGRVHSGLPPEDSPS